MKIKRFVCDYMFSANMYVCSSEKGNFIVDPGFYNEKVKNYLESIGKISFILLTHGHYDHISGINDLLNDFPNIPVYSYKDEYEVIMSTRKNCSAMTRDRDKNLQNYIPNCDILLLDEGENIIENYQFNVIHTPGHTKGSCLFYFKDENVLFTGDTIICESIGRYDLPTGSENKMFESINKIKSINFSLNTIVYFGHGEPYSYQTLKKYNIYLR